MKEFFLLKKDLDSFVLLLKKDDVFNNNLIFSFSDFSLFSSYIKGDMVINPFYCSLLDGGLSFLNYLFNINFSPIRYNGSGLCYYKGHYYIHHYIFFFKNWCIISRQKNFVLTDYISILYVYLGLLNYYNELGYFISFDFNVILKKYLLDFFSDSFDISKNIIDTSFYFSIFKDSVNSSLVFSYFIEIVERVIYLLDINRFCKKYGRNSF